MGQQPETTASRGGLTKATGQSRRNTLLSVQYLRGIAALGVATIHALDQIRDQSLAAPVQFLRSGVDVAFVISGFIMWYVLMRRPISPVAFLLRRAVRIVPMYWGVTSIMVGMMLVLPHLLQTARFGRAHVIASYLFVPWPNPAQGAGMRPVLMAGWTLNYEVFFYLLVAAALLLPRRIQLLTTAATLMAIAAAGPALSRIGPLAGYYASPLLIEFAFGILIAAIMMRVPSVPPGVCVAMIAIGFLELGLFGNRIAHDESNRLLVFGLPVVFIVAGIILLERQVGLPTIQIMKATGDASYSIYLTHTLLLSALAQIWRAELGTWPPALFVTGSIVGALVLGLLVNAYVERPMSNALAQRLIRRSPAQASPAGGSLARAEPR